VEQTPTPEEKISVVDPILLLSDILVDPFFRRQTIASTMLDWAITRERYGEGDEDVYTTSFAISRIGEDGDTEGTSFGPLVRTGFREIQRIPYFYREASEDLDNWVCVPKCNPLREPGVLRVEDSKNTIRGSCRWWRVVQLTVTVKSFVVFPFWKESGVVPTVFP